MRTMPKTSMPQPAAHSAAPGRSGRGACSSRLSSSTAGARAAAAQPERHDEEEAPRPAERGGEDPAEHEPGDHPAGQRGRERAERLLALALLPEGRGQQRKRRGHGERGAEPLNGARGEQRPGRAGQARRQRREREDDEAGHGRAAAAVEIACAPADQEERSERERVGGRRPVADPLARCRGRVRSPAGRPSRPSRRASRAGRRRRAVPAPRRATASPS